MEKKAQGAIEYLLIIGAAILVVAIVIIAITSVLNTSKTSGETALTDQQKQQNTLRCMSDINALGLIGTTDCSISAGGTMAACKCCSLSFVNTKSSKCK
jgi:ABC-type protease/lipase transport system fused ATPase/permease subunit